jgi:hypothetical protein
VRVEVPLAGFTAGWEFPGSRAFEEWAGRRRWLSQGGLAVVRTRSAAVADLLYPAICRCIRGVHGDERRLDILRVEVGEARSDPVGAMLVALDIAPTLTPFEAREPLRMRLVDRAVVIVLSERMEVPPAQWEHFVLLIEHYTKSTPAIELCVLVIDHRGAVAAEPSFDFTCGRSTHLVLSQAAEMEVSSLWAPYLHHRACWEAAGDPLHATELAERLMQVPHESDKDVESALSDFASWARARTGLVDLERDIVAATGRVSPAREAARRRLQDHGVMWEPPGLRRLELVPWASRAMLRTEGIAESLILVMRHNLVCTPLATEVLAQCLSAEARIRMQLANSQRTAPRADICASHERFLAGEDEFVVYPPNYPLPPSRPQDLWCFAPLGDTLRGSSNVPERFWETVKLRNAVAHGHYVCWTHIKRAWQQLRRFA